MLYDVAMVKWSDGQIEFAEDIQSDVLELDYIRNLAQELQDFLPRCEYAGLLHLQL